MPYSSHSLSAPDAAICYPLFSHLCSALAPSHPTPTPLPISLNLPKRPALDLFNVCVWNSAHKREGVLELQGGFFPPSPLQSSLVVCEPNTWKVEAHVQISSEKPIEVSFHWSLNVWWTACCLFCIFVHMLCMHISESSLSSAAKSFHRIAFFLCSFSTL